MAAETMAVQEKFKAFPAPYRKNIRMVRWGWRLVSGHYFPQKIAYDYVMDEVPNYKHIDAVCGGSFRFKK
jgi:hypothetical protein